MRALVFAGLLTACVPVSAQFVDVTTSANAAVSHNYVFGSFGEPDMMAGGIAGGDLDNDGDIDLLVLRGDIAPPQVLLNTGNGAFLWSATSGLSALGRTNGVLLLDAEGDGDLDALFGGTHGGNGGELLTPPQLWRNNGAAVFSLDQDAGIGSTDDTWSAAAADVDGDDDLDLWLAHWNKNQTGNNHLWRNLGNGEYAAADAMVGFADRFRPNDYTFTPNFADLDNDGDQDLTIAGDFGTSRVYRNQNTVFDEITGLSPISDQNGMGSALADYDNDGDLDWFVSSIFDVNGAEGNWGVTGNRLYRNTGNGVFEDVTSIAGVREGGWGWGACWADFNLDGQLDLLQTNGMRGMTMLADFFTDPTRLWINQGNGSFLEQSQVFGLNDTGNGRGVVCADFDRDGDSDVVISNRGDPGLGTPGVIRMFRNEAPVPNRGSSVRLRQSGANPQAVGARVYCVSDNGTQLRELQAGSHFLSSSPIEAHVANPPAQPCAWQVRWPDGEWEWFVAARGASITLQRGLGSDLFQHGFE